MKDLIKSPIYYSGCKMRNIRNGMIDLFPKEINTLVELFCGSCIVSLNTKANKFYLNDLNKNLIELIKMFDVDEIEILIEYFNKIRKTIGFQDYTNNNISFKKSSKNFKEEIMQEHKECYLKLRKMYNNTKDIRLLYLLTIYSFSHDMRFNKNGDFSMSVGNGKFIPSIIDSIYSFNSFLKNNNVVIKNKNFKEIKFENFNKDDFIYVDPPYLITTATYNENNGWTEEDESDLYFLLEKLNKLGIKWGMSNVVKHKGKVNNILKNFIQNYNVIDNQIVRSSFGKGNAQTQELYICNYEL